LDFKVKGHSKYDLKLKNELVTKSSNYADDRLLISANKQKKFKSNFFKTPTVFDIGASSFTMDYINGESFSQFFTRATKRDLDNLINRIDGYLEERIIGEIDLPIEILKDKITSIPINIDLLPILSNLESVKVKVGLCHGDMTLSNMIFSEDIYLIDFLDSYIESPTIDIVKLRQDTHLHWSLNMVNNIVDLTKIKLGMKYIDDWLVENHRVEYYEILQIINLLRIYPYTTDDNIKIYLEKNIKWLLEHL